MRRAYSGDAAGDHFAPFGNEPEEKLGIFIVNLDGFIGAEHTDFPSSKERTSESDRTCPFCFISFAKGTIFVFRHDFIHLFLSQIVAKGLVGQG